MGKSEVKHMAQKTKPIRPKSISSRALQTKTGPHALKGKATSAKATAQKDEIGTFLSFSTGSTPPPNYYMALLGLPPRPNIELLDTVQAGLNYGAFDHFQRVLQLPATEVARLLQIPSSTLVRRKERGRFDSTESERLLRFSRLFAAAVELFEGDADAARHWMQTPKPALNNTTPLEMARTEIGAREVENLIDRLENGVYS